MSVRSIVLAAALAASSTAAAAATPYRVTDLGTLGGTFSVANAINASGQITGSSQTQDGSRRAFLYAGGTMLDLGSLGGGSSDGQGINAAGLVTGTAVTAAGTGHAFLYANGSMLDLGTLGGDFSQGLDINAAGQVTGSSQTAEPFTTRAFLYSQGTLQSIGGRTGWGINDSGHVTGDAGSHAFVYSNGTLQDIHGLGDSSVGRDINDAGQVTGSFDDNLTITRHAFLFTNGAMQDLGSIGFYQGSVGLAINNHGWVAGVAFPALTDDPDLTADRAFLYDGTAMHDLNTLLDGSGDGWVLHAAHDINDAGQIVGWGLHDGQTRGFLLTPVPEPGTWALMLTGLGLMGGVVGARRRFGSGRSAP